MDTRNKIFAVVGTVAILATAGITGVVLFTNKDTTSTGLVATNTSQTTSTNTPATSSSPSASTSTNNSSSANSSSTDSSSSTTSSAYKDGTYTASVGYYVPHGGQNTLKATVVISSGKISSVTTNNEYTDRESGMYINMFENMVNSDCIGHMINGYNPSRIGGASLTTQAFADALSDIANQAKA